MPAEQKPIWRYFILPDKDGQPSKAGASEAFAEAYAACRGGGCIQKKHFRPAYPRCVAYMEKTLKWLGTRYSSSARDLDPEQDS